MAQCLIKQKSMVLLLKYLMVGKTIKDFINIIASLKGKEIVGRWRFKFF
jgi:hypothetical protein